MLSILGNCAGPESGTHAAGITRRRILQAGGAGLLGLDLPTLLAAEAAGTPRAKSVIFLFLFGGPSQLETSDMNPDAPADIRGSCRNRIVLGPVLTMRSRALISVRSVVYS
jgi:hypothetical protein